MSGPTVRATSASAGVEIRGRVAEYGRIVGRKNVLNDGGLAWLHT
jgi:hypothetical protein